ncbi:MAG: hypothetical protein HeimC3_13260 [Candidatus Heimdallarchaeota archaeon LC_3]|nr:MAG: hypothetical protein HeimC3_13260 [Candidatus Heimdallarchaeota archaeon LC_3]
MRLLFPSTGWKGSIRTYTSSFSWNDEVVLNIDKTGRWLSVIFDQTTYRRALNSNWMSIKREHDNNSRIRNFLDSTSTNLLYSKIAKAVNDLEKIANNINIAIDFEQNDPIKENNTKKLLFYWLNLMKRFNYELELKEKALYNSVYSKVGILPPDRYGSLVLQSTIGCVYNKCSFCDFYQNIKFHQKSPEEFQEHIKKVKSFIGESIGRFHSIFLGDANALFIPHQQLMNIFNIINKEFQISKSDFSPGLIFKNKPNFAGIYSFLDVFSGHNKKFDEFKQLKEKGLRSVYLGIESGSKKLLNFLNKPNKLEDILTLVNNLHQADIGVVTIFLIGAGGKEYEKDHLKDTIHLIRQLKLTKKDLIYFSTLVPPPDTEYGLMIKEENIPMLNNRELEEQIIFLKNELNQMFLDKKNKPKIAKYEIRDFLY